MVTIYLSLLGPTGLRQLAELNLAASLYLREQLPRYPGLALAFDRPVFNELTLRLPGRNAAQVRDALLDQGLLAGHPLTAPGEEDLLLVHVSELHRREELDRLLQALAQG